jgi:hypothetical protein
MEFRARVLFTQPTTTLDLINLSKKMVGYKCWLGTWVGGQGLSREDSIVLRLIVTSLSDRFWAEVNRGAIPSPEFRVVILQLRAVFEHYAALHEAAEVFSRAGAERENEFFIGRLHSHDTSSCSHTSRRRTGMARCVWPYTDPTANGLVNHQLS